MLQKYLARYYSAMTDPLRISLQVTMKHICRVLLLVGMAPAQHCRKIDIDSERLLRRS
jgi:hypothetical protein